PPRATLVPYTTLFRSVLAQGDGELGVVVVVLELLGQLRGEVTALGDRPHQRVVDRRHLGAAGGTGRLGLGRIQRGGERVGTEHQGPAVDGGTLVFGSYSFPTSARKSTRLN